MIRPALPAMTALLLAACASGGGQPTPGGPDARRFTVSPTVLVAASSRLVSEIRTNDEPADIYEDYFTENATILYDHPRGIAEAGLMRETLLQRLAKGSLNEAVISCDGRTGVTSGTLPADEMTNAYDIVWKKVAKDEWLIAAILTGREDGGSGNDFIQSFTAGCDAPEDSPVGPPAEGLITGRSADNSLYWEMRHGPGVAPSFTLGAWDGDEWVTRD